MKPAARVPDERRARYAIVLMNSAGDQPAAALGGRTPLEMASTPNCDAIVRRGRQGTVATIPAGRHPSDDVGLVSLLGYDPRDGYPGPGPVEAAGRRIPLGPDEIMFRCNLVTVSHGEMIDARGGGIPASQATELIDELNRRLGGLGARFHA